MSRDQGMSLVAVILALAPSGEDLEQDLELSEVQHAKAAEWFALQLSIRDRQEIVRVLCHRNPDLLTAAVQDGVAAYTPMIRLVHQAVNLSESVWDFERFVTDLVGMSRPVVAGGGGKGGGGGEGKGEQGKMPCVEDYVDLLHRHQGSVHKFLHQVAKNGREVSGWWRGWVGMVAAQFQTSSSWEGSDDVAATATTRKESVRQAMESFFPSLSDEDTSAVKAELDAHHAYLDALHAASAARISAVIQRTRSTPLGPGAYLARWQDLLDRTVVTPGTAEGSVRWGASRSVREGSREGVERGGVEIGGEGRLPEVPGVEVTVRVFGARFREVLAGGGGG